MRAHSGKPWELTDTGHTVAEILRRGRARAGTTLVAYLDNDSQDIGEVRRLATPVPYRGDDEEEEFWAMDAVRAELLAIAQEICPARTFDGDGGSPMQGTLVTVVCREGRAVSTDVEWQFMPAWRYSNHFMAAYDGDIVVVTPHGWASTFYEMSGHVPALRARPALPLVPAVGADG